MTEAVRAIAGDVKVKHHVGRRPQLVEHVPAQRRRFRQDEQPRRIRAQSEFDRRTQHSLAVDTENSATRNLTPIGHRRAQRGERDLVADLHVGRPTPHVAFRPVACIDIDARHLGRIRMSLEPQHLGNDDSGKRCTDPVHPFDGKAERGEMVANRLDVVTEIGELLQPRVQDLHVNCLRKRRSLVYISRMSSTA